ncbi:hypothetical protein [Streptomyces sp. NBC_00887]|uniref:hypothetical protein n=1 Tax=Streptomyces sp. NBC_00887 TaxID=2975859 RepID=UPI00386694FC|nr:hypothetical protein OG844_03915 [Streptomyces sp. NBC_00887]WSY35760.1 hypothetical protein OG844_41685 [Streptomyces sp. NBC_00887]
MTDEGMVNSLPGLKAQGEWELYGTRIERAARDCASVVPSWGMASGRPAAETCSPAGVGRTESGLVRLLDRLGGQARGGFRWPVRPRPSALRGGGGAAPAGFACRLEVTGCYFPAVPGFPLMDSW